MLSPRFLSPPPTLLLPDLPTASANTSDLSKSPSERKEIDVGLEQKKAKGQYEFRILHFLLLSSEVDASRLLFLYLTIEVAPASDSLLMSSAVSRPADTNCAFQ